MSSVSRIKTPLAWLGVAACVALGAGAAQAQSYHGDGYSAGEASSLTVYARRHPLRYPDRDEATGAPIETVTASRAILFHASDLRTPWGRRALRVRIIRAADDACDQLGQDNFVTQDITDRECVDRAVRGATFRVRRIDAAYRR